MQMLYGGFIEDGYRIRTYIADQNAGRMEFLIKAYVLTGRKVGEAKFPMYSAPSWRASHQRWVLSKLDEKNLETLTQRLMGVLRRNR